MVPQGHGRCTSSFLPQLEQVDSPKNDATRSAPYAYKFRSFTLDAPQYLQWLAARVQSPDGPHAPARIVRVSTLNSLAQAAALVPEAELLVNATGLGSQDLQEVKDGSMYPIRGQTVLVKAPRFQDAQHAHCVSTITPNGASYVIPRARSGQVILGGTFDVRRTDKLVPDATVTERILKNAVLLAPELLPEGVDPTAPDAWTKIEVLKVNIGVRPAREGGARVELDATPLRVGARNVGVIHAYGIGTWALLIQARPGTRRVMGLRKRSPSSRTSGSAAPAPRRICRHPCGREPCAARTATPGVT